MKKKDRYANDEFIRFLKWVRQNQELWNLICGHGKEEMTMEGFRTILSKMQKEALYIPMYVFLSVYKDVKYVSVGIEAMFLELFIRDWRTRDTDIYEELYEVLN